MAAQQPDSYYLHEIYMANCQNVSDILSSTILSDLPFTLQLYRNSSHSLSPSVTQQQYGTGRLETCHG